MLSLTGIRIPVAALAVALCCLTSTARSADPKVKTASHEFVEQAAPEETPQENVTSKGDGLSYSPKWPEPPNTGAMLMRLFFGTVVVLGLCVGSLWYGKPWLQRLQFSGAASSSMSIQGTVTLGNRAMLYLVRVGDTQLVAGTDASGLKSLIAIPASFKEVLDDQLPQVEAVDAPETASFESKE